MVGCTEMAQPADPQSNAQEEILTISGAVTATAVQTIDLAKVEGDSVAVATVTTDVKASDDAELRYYVTLNDTYEFEVAADMTIPVDELQALVEEVHGKNPVERKFSAVVTVAAVVRGSAVLYKSEKFDVVIIPVAPSYVEYIYAPGNHQNWNPESAPALHGPKFDGVWTGYSMLDGGFKFVQERAWVAEYNKNDFTTLPEGFTPASSDDDTNIYAGKNAFYYIKADVAGSKLEVIEIKSYGVIGDAAPNGWDSDVDMTWQPEKLAFVVNDIVLKDGQIKFRANDDWGANVGGSFDDLVDGGDNINVTAGTYDIELYLQRTPESNEKMTAKVTKK